MTIYRGGGGIGRRLPLFGTNGSTMEQIVCEVSLATAKDNNCKVQILAHPDELPIKIRKEKG